MSISIHSVQNFQLNDEREGILQFYKDKNAFSFNTSAGSDDPKIVLQKGRPYWITLYNSTENFFGISFNKLRILLSYIALYSCQTGECVGKLNVEGSLDNARWYEVCQYRGESSNFKGQYGSFPCKSPKTYSHFRLKMAETNDNGEWKFPIYYIEFFGKVFLSVITNNCERSKINKLLVFIIALSNS